MNHRFVFGIVLVIAACLVAAAPLSAQMPQMPTPQEQVETLDQAVDLTDDQKAQVLKLYTDMQANMGGGMGGGGMMGGGMMMGGRMGGMLTDQSPLAEILTAAQIEKYNAYTLKQQVDRQVQTIDELVTLTDDQKPKVASVVEKEVTARNEMMAEMMGQGMNGDFQGMMAQMQELTAATDKALEAILTPAQMTTYNSRPQRGMGGMGGGMGGGMR